MQWSEEQIQIVQDMTKTPNEVSRIVKRSSTCVRTKRYELALDVPPSKRESVILQRRKEKNARAEKSRRNRVKDTNEVIQLKIALEKERACCERLRLLLVNYQDVEHPDCWP